MNYGAPASGPVVSKICRVGDRRSIKKRRVLRRAVSPFWHVHQGTNRVTAMLQAL